MIGQVVDVYDRSFSVRLEVGPIHRYWTAEAAEPTKCPGAGSSTGRSRLDVSELAKAMISTLDVRVTLV